MESLDELREETKLTVKRSVRDVFSNDSQTLRSCPFCGSNDLYIITQMIGRESPFCSADDCTVGIFCNTCKQTVTLEANEDEGRDFGTEQRAIAAWNRRAE